MRIRIVVFLMLVGALFISSSSFAQSKMTKTPSYSKTIMGVWALVDKVTDVPTAGSRLKFILDGHWTLTQNDSTTGLVAFHHGGSYTLEGKTYTEHVEYANSNTASYIKSTAKFNIQIQDNIMTLTGIGNPWNEIWKRIKSN